MGKRRCRECGAKYEDGFQHCPVCGAEAGRRIARCKACGSRLAGMQKGRCPVCGKKLRDWGWVRPLLKIAAVVLFVLLLAATYVYSYVPQLGMPTPVWPTSTATVTLTATRAAAVTPSDTPTRVPPTRTRTPTWTPIPPTATRLPQRTYVVQYGDSLWGIADMFEISIEALMIANNLTNSDLIHEDDIMVIPTGTPTPPVIPTATPRPAAPVTRLPIATSTPKP
jgi:LysM repeat protein/RNA polymerase subunit RPABC4/transcription elongation factor Spt4